MTCSQAQRWLQEYLDGRLDSSHLAALQRHLHGCPSCRSDLVMFEVLRDALSDDSLEAMVPAPVAASLTTSAPSPLVVPDLAPAVLQRIARADAERAAAKERSAALWRERSWQGMVALLVIALAWLVLPGGGDGYNRGLNHALTSASAALLAPGPDSIAWLAWIVGVGLVLALLITALRAESATAWRRAVSQRLPQLW